MAVLLFLFAIGHTLGFRDSDPTWGIGPVIAAMQSTHFTIHPIIMSALITVCLSAAAWSSNRSAV